jgi:hypothetical protein
MMDKLKAKRASLVAEEKDLSFRLETVKKKIGIVDEMIVDETNSAESAEKKTIEFGTLPRSF